MSTAEHDAPECRLCKSFANHETLHDVDFEQREGEALARCPYFQLHNELGFRRSHDRYDLIWWPAPWMEGQYVLEIRCFMRTEWWDVYTEVGSATLPGLASAAEPGDSNDSLESWSFIKACRTACQNEHPLCRQDANEKQLPPRLLAISEQDLSLVDSNSLPGESTYLALSYCWGSNTSLCSTKATEAQFRERVPPDIIPPVISDAIVFAREMGIQFVWIDRLCIMQDDKADWAQHAGIMDRIYEQAELVIAAVTSSSADQPFLGRDSVELRKQIVSTPVQWPGDGESEYRDIRVRIRKKYTDVRYQGKAMTRETLSAAEGVAGPLDRRGWTFQEHFLAQRSVRYEPTQVVWECLSAMYMEAFPLDDVRLQGRFITQGQATIEDWSAIVSAFSHRRLTYDSDRGAAVSGFAARYQKLLGLRYLAGLWDGYLLTGLCWTVTTRGFTAEDHYLYEGHAISGAPTWSWLSINLPVYGHYSTLRPDDEFTDIQILRHDIVPATANALGQVILPAALTLKAPLLDAILRCNGQARITEKATTEPRYKASVQWKKRRTPVGEVSIDCYLARKKISLPKAASRHASTSGQSSSTALRFTRFGTPRALEPVRRPDEAAVKILKVDDSRCLILSEMDLAESSGADGYRSFERLGVLILNQGGDVDLKVINALRKDSTQETFFIV